MSDSTTIYATTDNEMQAAAIALRLIEDAGRNATTRDVSELVAEGFPIRSSYRYAVIIDSADGADGAALDPTLRCPVCGKRADMCFAHGDDWKKR